MEIARALRLRHVGLEALERRRVGAADSVDVSAIGGEVGVGRRGAERCGERGGRSDQSEADPGACVLHMTTSIGCPRVPL